VTCKCHLTRQAWRHEIEGVQPRARDYVAMIWRWLFYAGPYPFRVIVLLRARMRAGFFPRGPDGRCMGCGRLVVH
jgi:hypothetical protein